MPERTNVIRPRKAETMSDREWAAWFEQQQSWYSGDAERSAQLIISLIEGMHFVIEQALRDKAVFQEPRIAFLKGSTTVQLGYVSSVPDGNILLVAPESLAKFSAFPHDKLIEFSNEGEPTAMIATMPEMYYLGGVEETDHARFRQVHGIQGRSLISTSLPQEEYDAQPHELSALRCCLLAANEKSLHRKTLEMIQQRISNAESFLTRQKGQM